MSITHAAAGRETLDDKASLITTLPEDLRAALYAIYDQRCTELAEEA